MGNRLSKIYTRTGDDGSTGLGDGTRVAKDSARVSAYGTVDELNSCIGMVIAEVESGDIAEWLTEIQHELFDLGGELCIPGSSMIDTADITRLETRLDALNDPLPPLKEFILPGGNRAAAVCHLARTVVVLFTAAVCALLAHASWTLVMLERGGDAEIFAGVPTWWALAILPVVVALMCLHSLGQIGRPVQHEPVQPEAVLP